MSGEHVSIGAPWRFKAAVMNITMECKAYMTKYFSGIPHPQTRFLAQWVGKYQSTKFRNLVCTFTQLSEVWQ